MSHAVTPKKRNRLRGKGGVVAVGVVILLGVWLALDLNHPVREPDSNPLISDIIRVMSPDVTRVEVKRSKAPFTLVKERGNWRFEAPGTFRADKEQVGSWLKGLLEGGNVAQTVEAQKADPNQFGFDKPAAELVLTSGAGTRTLQIGKDFRPVGDQAPGSIFYARNKEDGRLFMLNTAQVIALRDKPLDELRDRKLIDAPATKEVNKVTLTRPNGTLEARRAGEGWELLQPFRAPADKTNLETLVDQLRLGTAVAFVDGGEKDLAKYGLDRPRLIAQLWDGAGPHGIRFGKESKDGKVYAAREGENSVVTIEKTSYQGFDKTAADLRELRLITLEADRISSLDIHNPHGDAKLEKAGQQGWDLVDAKTNKRPKANAETVERILSAIRSNAFQHVEEAPKDLAKYGLDQPRITVKVSDGSGATQTLTLGKTAPGGDYYAKGPPNAVFTVKSFTYADLNVLPSALLPTKPDAPK